MFRRCSWWHKGRGDFTGRSFSARCCHWSHRGCVGGWNRHQCFNTWTDHNPLGQWEPWKSSEHHGKGSRTSWLCLHRNRKSFIATAGRKVYPLRRTWFRVWDRFGADKSKVRWSGQQDVPFEAGSRNHWLGLQRYPYSYIYPLASRRCHGRRTRHHTCRGRYRTAGNDRSQYLRRPGRNSKGYRCPVIFHTSNRRWVDNKSRAFQCVQDNGGYTVNRSPCWRLAWCCRKYTRYSE